MNVLDASEGSLRNAESVLRLSERVRISAAIEAEERRVDENLRMIGKLYMSRHPDECKREFGDISSFVEESRRKIEELEETLRGMMGPTAEVTAPPPTEPVPPPMPTFEPVRAEPYRAPVSQINATIPVPRPASPSFSRSPLDGADEADEDATIPVEPFDMDDEDETPGDDGFEEISPTVPISAPNTFTQEEIKSASAGARFCIHCGAKVSGDSIFCTECGAKL